MTTAPMVPISSATATFASLYVGDLAPEATEQDLYPLFGSIGPLLSVRVIRTSALRESLGYAYVNYQQANDAERAIDALNFESIRGKPMRIMWSERDPAKRRAGNGNIFIKNLDKSVDSKSIFDTFSIFGTVLSCKVAFDEKGESRGFGFVHFAREEDGQRAIDKVNNMLLAGRKVEVCKFVPRDIRDRKSGNATKTFTNVYVKNFGDRLNQKALEELFSKFGKIESCKVMEDPETKKPKGFGFVAFKDHEAAAKAVEELNGALVPGAEDIKLVVCRAQKKKERLTELRIRHEANKMALAKKYANANLYVKYLDDTVDDEALIEAFKEFGVITSAKVMVGQDGRSKGFGFVCFEKAEDAKKAIEKRNSSLLGSKPIAVCVAQRKEERRANLANQYMQRQASMRQGAAIGSMYMPGMGGHFTSNPIGHGQPSSNNRSYAPTPGAINSSRGGARMAHPRGGWNNTSNNIGGYGGGSFGGPGVPMPGQFGQNRQPYNIRPSHAPTSVLRPMSHLPPVRSYDQQPGGVRMPNHPQMQRLSMPSSPNGPIDTMHLAGLNEDERREFLGERLFPLFRHYFPHDSQLGEKVTGMLLELDASEIIHILSNHDDFLKKASEALRTFKLNMKAVGGSGGQK